MTASTDFLAFATGGGANVESQATWLTDAVVTNGFSSGLASSAKVNKALRQGSFIAAGLATWVSQQINGNVPDDGNLTNFVTFLSQALTAYNASLGNVFINAAGLSFGSNTTITLAQLGGWGKFTSAITATLPALAGTTLGQAFTFIGGATGGTIKGNASETITPASGSAANTRAVVAGETVTVVANSSTWQVVEAGMPAALASQFQYADQLSAGTTSVTSPAWANHAQIVVIGGGGGGGSSASGYSGGGGGAGGYVEGIVSITPSTGYSVTVGAGGAAGSGGAGGTGGASSFASLATANGGGGGAASAITIAGGSGGSATGSGLRAFTGGYGGDGNNVNNAYPGGNGAGGPFGGQGRSGAGGGYAGAAPGAGGGGAWNGSGNGGAGAVGAVLIKWLP